MIALLTSCDPISYFWTSTYDLDAGHFRYSFYDYYIGNAAANVVIDLLILLIPIPVFWNLHMRITQKLMITSLFFIGVLYVFVSFLLPPFLLFSLFFASQTG